jgi:hypothetical protein
LEPWGQAETLPVEVDVEQARPVAPLPPPEPPAAARR